MELKKVTMDDKKWVAPLMWAAKMRGSEYTFSNLFNWSPIHAVLIGEFDGFLIVRSVEEAPFYYYPAGKGDPAKAIEAMAEDAKRLDVPFKIYNVSTRERAILEEKWPDRFEFEARPDYFDYIYLRESLETLSGKKLRNKRNHIARFCDNNPNWTYEKITAQNIDEVHIMNREWCVQNGCDESASLQNEACAVKNALRHYSPLELTGGLLRDGGGKIIAFTFGSPVTEDTFVIHAEKAFADIQGAYPMINQQFVINELSAYTYVNREEDLGIPGLRKAKHSYRPAFMYERHLATQRQ